MREFQAKKKVRRYIYSWPIIAVIIIFIVIVAHATWGVYKKEKESAANVAQASRELDTLQNRETTLNSEINRLSTDEGVEEEIRSTYNVAKPGEHVLVIVDQNATTTTENATQETWWTKFKNLFK